MTKKPSVEILFDAALQIESQADRGAFLDRACDGDKELRSEIERLLEVDLHSRGPLDQPAVMHQSTVSRSVLESLGQSIGGVPSVLLREAKDTARALNINSPELPKDKSEGRYQLHGELARGGMGAVIKGRDTDLGRDLVLKVLLDAHKGKSDYVRRFIEEAQIGGQLQHPGIVPVYELGQLQDGRPFFSMKLVKGETLAALLSDRENASDGRAKLLGIFQQVCQTVAYVHSKGVIHRDLKPANMMVGAFGEVQVMDWGLGKVLTVGGIDDERRSIQKHSEVSVIRTFRSEGSDTGDLVGSDTRLGSVMGTFAYMPPEQALGEVDRLDERADVFSLGAILTEILTGKPPYVAKDGVPLHRLATSGKLDDCLARLDACGADSEIVGLARACLATEPEERPKNAAVLAQRMATYQTSLQQRLKDAELERVASETRAVEERRRRRLLVRMCTVLALLGVSAVIAAGGFGIASDRNRRLAAENSAKTQQAQAAQERAEDTAAREKIRRLATESQDLRNERPVRSVLLAMEAVKLSRQLGADMLPIAHEALLNSTHSLEGYPLTGQAGATRRLAMSSEYLVTQGVDGTLRLWNLSAEDPTNSRVLAASDEGIKSFVLSHDGRWLITAGNKLQRWDLTGTSESRVLLSGAEITSMGLSSNGQWLVTQSKAGEVKRWDLASPTTSAPRVLARQSDRWYQILVSPDGHWVAGNVHPATTVQFSHNGVRLIEVSDHSCEFFPLKRSSGEDGDYCDSVAMSPDGRWLATDGEKGLRFWDLSSDKPVDAPRDEAFPAVAHTSGVRRSLLFSQDGRRLIGRLGEDDRHFVLEVDANGAISSPRFVVGNDSSSEAASTDGRWFASGGMSGHIRVWNLATDEVPEPYVLKAHDLKVSNIEVEGKWMATLDASGIVRLWSLGESTLQTSPFVLRGENYISWPAFATSSTGRWVAAEIRDDAFELWDMEHSVTPSPVITRSKMHRGRHGEMRGVKFSHDERWLVTSSDDTVKLWDLESEDPTSSPVIVDGARPVAVSPGGGWLATEGGDSRVQLWDLNSESPAESTPVVLEKHEFSVDKMSISPDSRWLVTLSQTSARVPVEQMGVRIRLWDLKADDVSASMQQLDGENQYVWDLKFDATSRWLAASGGPNVRLWDLRAEQPALPSRVISGETTIFRFAIGRDAQWLFIARYSGVGDAQLWDLRDPERPITHEIYECDGNAVATSPDGRWLVAGNRYKFNAFLFDLEAENPVASARVLRGHAGPIWNVEFSADSRWLATAGSDGALRRWNLDVDWLLNYAGQLVGRELTEPERKLYDLTQH